MQSGEYKYLATAGADKVVTTKPAVLHRIIIGANVASGVVEVSDHASDGDGNVKIKLSSSTLLGVIEVDAVFKKGITADLTNQTDVTFIFSPGGAA